jgi:predicted RND superfamily exporter protein
MLALLTAGILVALVGALELAGWYIEHHFHNTGKGSRTLLPELIFYTPTLLLALTLLLTLLFRHWLWHVLFFLMLVAQIIFLYWLYQL